MVPPVRAVFTTAELDGKYLCAAEMPSVDLTERPCYYSGAGRTKGSYVRVGDADLPITDYEIHSYESFRSHQHDDERAVDRASISLLDAERLQDNVSTRACQWGLTPLARHGVQPWADGTSHR